ncbi:MAG: hypothetical protein V4724_14415 [Pseudomonadota bacterium]
MNSSANIQLLNGPDGRPAYVVIPYDDYIREYKQDSTYTQHEVVSLMVKNDWPQRVRGANTWD